MRDRAKLFTQVYVPKDGSRTYPFLIMRTPYGVAPYGSQRYRSLLGPSEIFDRAGYIFVFQDVRGRYQSEGQFVEARPHLDHSSSSDVDESTDMYDSMEWLLEHVHGNNGNAGVWGMSYPGFYTTASIINTHPAIKAASPQAPVTNLFLGDDAYHNGALMLAAQFEFYATFFKPRAANLEFPPAEPGHEFAYDIEDGYKYFLQHGPEISRIRGLIHNPFFDQTAQHDTYDEYWKSRDIAAHLQQIRCAVLNVGGWFDAEDEAGTFRTFHAIDKGNPGMVNILAVGPWAHGDWVRSSGSKLGALDFGSPTVEFYRKHIVFPFFEHYLKGTPLPDLPKAYVFETGTNRWLRYDAWPPKAAQTTTIYLHDHGRLSFDPPAHDETPFDQFTSDPKNPVPYLVNPPTQIAEEYMYSDQSFASKRTDVLTYLSEPLKEDLTIVGPISPHLLVSTSQTDSDFDLKLIDGYPEGGAMGGYQQLVRGEPMRAKFRNSFSTPEPMVRNKVTPVNFDMPDANHTFKRGHRIIVQIQSSWFPLTDLNPQTFTDIVLAKPSDFVAAIERVYHYPGNASRVLVKRLENH